MAPEAYFELARRQQAETARLRRRIATLEARCGLTGEARHARSRALLSRLVSRSLGDVVRAWRARVEREHGWKRLRAAADRRWEAGGAPRALYKWVAYMEASKRARWQRAAEMAQWEAKYSRPADAN